jgi:hypothetical protein
MNTDRDIVNQFYVSCFEAQEEKGVYRAAYLNMRGYLNMNFKENTKEDIPSGFTINLARNGLAG